MKNDSCFHVTDIRPFFIAANSQSKFQSNLFWSPGDPTADRRRRNCGFEIKAAEA